MKFKKTSKTPFHRYAFSKRSNVCIFAAMLTLNKKYTAREIDHACFLASEALTFSYRAVLQFIETAREQTALSAVSAENTIVNSHKFERDISEYADALKTMTKKGVPYEH